MTADGSAAPARLRVGAVQLTAGPDKAANLATITRLIDRAAALGCELVALPEVATQRGPGAYVEAEPIPGPTTALLAARAREHGLWVHGGSFFERAPEGGERVFNTTVLFDPHGQIVARYRKVHLFDVAIPGGVSSRESARVAPGDEVVTADVGRVRVGLSVCYDLRFPELYRLLALRGAQVLFVPAAFTAFTGKDHWEVLLRARAIENQAFVVAPAQIGGVGDSFRCHGRSLIVDPWGLVLAQAPDEETVIVADLDLGRLERIRAELPSLANRRPEVYAVREAGVRAVDGGPGSGAPLPPDAALVQAVPA